VQDLILANAEGGQNGAPNAMSPLVGEVKQEILQVPL
jgi:hypothetical protein